jgi:acetylornithine aminotransferase
MSRSQRGLRLKSALFAAHLIGPIFLSSRTAMALIEAASPHTMNTYGRVPIALSHGQGVYVWDVNGKRYLDGLAGIAVNTLGHAHPKLVPALQDQVAKLIHTSNYYHIPLQE